MRKLLLLTLVFAPLASAQLPSLEAMSIELGTMAKTYATCRASYTQALPGHKQSIVEEVIGREAYQKDLTALGHAENIAKGLRDHPDKITGAALFLLLSTSDDFGLGLQSTRTEILKHAILADRKVLIEGPQPLALVTSLQGCQSRLFDDGDTFVGLAEAFIGAEDAVVAKESARHSARKH